MSTEAGYGGGRGFPHLERGFLVDGHPAVGKPMPQPDVDGVPLDQLMGDGFALVADHDVSVPAEVAWLDPQVVTVPAGVLPPGLIDDGKVAIVRPDRYVAAVSADVAAVARQLADIAGVTDRRST